MSVFFEGMDKIFIREFVGFEGLGLYTVAFKIVAVLSILQLGFSMFWVPTSYEHYERDPNDKTLYEKMFKYVSFVLVFCGLGLMAIKDIIVLLFNKPYAEAASIMPFLIFIPIMYILSEITYLGINFTKKTYWHIVIFGILLLLCPLFNYIFVSWLGVKGAALSVALSYTTYLGLRTIISIRLYPMNFHLGKTSLAILLLFIVAGINTFVASKTIGISCAAFALFIYLLLHISTIKDMFIYFKQMAVNFVSR
jgi:O-antigen/teichoic acid export membrane protein